MIMFMMLIFLVLFSIAFITLYERHLLALSHNRLGPFKVSFLSLLQAVFDGLKLFIKEVLYPCYSYNIFFLLIPIFLFFVMFLDWFVLPYYYNFISFSYMFLFFLCLIGVLVYFMLLMGIFSKSKYSFFGGVRSCCQSISFEIIFFFLLFGVLILSQSYFFIYYNNLIFLMQLLIYLILILVELNRPPFDFSEGESELVSGFNLEFSSILFVYLFLSEFGFLIFFSVFLSNLMFYMNNFYIFALFTLILLLRSSYPRYRYDLLMMFFWLILLPLIMLMFIYLFFMFYI